MNLSDAAKALDDLNAKRGGDRAVAEKAGAILRKLKYSHLEDLPAHDVVFDDELIEGVIGRIALAVIYGDSNCGKTFFAVDLARAIAMRTDWMSHHAHGGLVLYLATEGPASVKTRFRAAQKFHASRIEGVVIVESPINLYDGDADTNAVLALVSDVESYYGEKVVLVIGDTLARLSAGANENSGEDMGVVLKHADIIKESTQATFLLIHHCGKDAARGMRGWSGLRAAVDTEIEISVDETTGIRTAEVTKQRDIPGKGLRIGFRLEPVELGINAWGTPRGSMVVVPADAPVKQTQAKRPSEIAGAITEFLSVRGSGCLKSEIVKHFDGRYNSGAVYREIKKMVEAKRLHETAGIVAAAGKA